MPKYGGNEISASRVSQKWVESRRRRKRRKEKKRGEGENNGQLYTGAARKPPGPIYFAIKHSIMIHDNFKYLEK